MPTSGTKLHVRATSRRQFLRAGAATLAFWGLRPAPAVAAPRDPRFLLVILRGGLDGLSAVAPVGDPDYAPLRGTLALSAEGPSAGLRLDPLFVLNRSMSFLHGLYEKRQALVVHAVATPYRARSHFDGQDVLESGLPGVARADDGWLNRALSALPGVATAPPPGVRQGLAIGPVVPLVMRGPAPVVSWIPQTSSLPLRASTLARLADLYAAADPRLARALAEGAAIDRVGGAGSGLATGRGTAGAGPAEARPFRDLVETAEVAARFLRAADGPRIGALSFNGWDTHANEGAIDGQLATRLAGLDLALRTFAEGVGPAWDETVVAVVTEFGRTARPNGTAGTDHGTATAAFVLGGRVSGGRVIADWPGLAEPSLHEARDLRPTTDLRAVLKGLLADHLGLSDERLATAIFPDSRAMAPMRGLIA